MPTFNDLPPKLREYISKHTVFGWDEWTMQFYAAVTAGYEVDKIIEFIRAAETIRLQSAPIIKS